MRDTGVGIAPDVQARLFQPFEQADRSTSRRCGARLLLLRYRETQRELGARFRVAHAQGALRDAMRLAHDLRGLSGTIGALHVQRLAQSLEQACIDEVETAAIEPLFASVEQELRMVLERLESLLA